MFHQKNRLWKMLFFFISCIPLHANNENITHTIEYTFAMIKPDAVRARNTGKIIDLIEQNSFAIIFMQKVQFSKESAKHFYAEHQGRSFFEKLINYITSGPIIIMMLAKENAIIDWRTLMGPTDSTKAPEGTIRYLFGTDITKNAIHGSDCPKTAQREINLFFPGQSTFPPFQEAYQ